MKKFEFLMALLLLVSGVYAKQMIVISNSLSTNRSGEMVEVKVSTLKADFQHKSYILKNEAGKEVAYQIIFTESNKPEYIIFQADVKAKSSASYSIAEGKPAPVVAKTYARFVPERKDDFAWENDMAAYRMYGPALANENPSNGVDYWAKCTDKLVVDQRYKDEEFNKISYHIDHGMGLDFYKVAHSLGCGGIAPYAEGKLWVGNHFDSYKLIVSGPLRAEFTLTYDSVQVGKNVYKQVITITTDAGSLLNKATVIYSGNNKLTEVAAGMTLHEGKGTLKLNAENGTAALTENAVSDAGLPSGRDYIGVYVPVKVKKATEQEEHGLLIVDYIVGKPFDYYFGAGWSKWLFSTDEDWFKAVNRFAELHKNPLKVTIK
jgi:hypothetical protein